MDQHCAVAEQYCRLIHFQGRIRGKLVQFQVWAENRQGQMVEQALGNAVRSHHGPTVSEGKLKSCVQPHSVA